MPGWSINLADAVESLEDRWLGVRRPHPLRLLRGLNPAPFDAESQAFRADQPAADYCPRCGSSVGVGEFIEGRGCAACRRRRHPWERLVRLGRFEGDLREWVHEIKFSAWDAMGVELGRLLGRALLECDARADAIVPVPVWAWRRWRRGIDHTRIIAGGVASVLRLPVLRAMKRRGRPPQRAVPASQRRDNVRGAFSMRRWHGLGGCRIILIDDVTTTRATLTEACNTLRAAGVDSIIAAVIAVTETARRRGDVLQRGDERPATFGPQENIPGRHSQSGPLKAAVGQEPLIPSVVTLPASLDAAAPLVPARSGQESQAGGKGPL